MIYNIPGGLSQTFENTVVGTETLSTRPVIFADPLGHLHVGWTSGSNTGKYLKYSTNQSGQWAFSRDVAGSSHDGIYVATITADKYGFSYISSRFDGYPFDIKYYTNKNLTSYYWSQNNVMSSEHFHQTSIEVSSDQSVHVFAEENEKFGSSGIFYNSIAALSDTVIFNTRQHYSTTIDQNDDLHAVAYRNQDIWYTKYSSSSWSSQVAIDDPSTDGETPSITCDQNGKLHVAYRTPIGIYYTNNTSGSWSTPETVYSGVGLYFPDVVIDENGIVHIAYITNNEEANPANNDYLYYQNNISGSWSTQKLVATINTDVIPGTRDAAEVDSKIALDLKNSTVNIVYVQNGNQVTVASTDDYELRSSKSTDVTSTLSSSAGTPTVDTLTTFDASSLLTLLQFTITDVANDGEPTKVESIVFQRGPGMSDDVCFNDLFANMTIEEVGQSSEALTLNSSRARIGTQGSVWKSIAEGGSKNFILKGVLNSSLSTVLDKDFQIKINGLYDVITDNTGSLFSYSSSNIVSDTLRIKEVVLSGSGTQQDPYLITSLNDLRAVSEASSYWNDYLKQTADIDATATSTWNNGEGFSPIGNFSPQFTGSYDGDGHTIDGIYINQTWGFNVGVFGNISGASIQNLGLSSLNITSYSTTGGLVASSMNSTISYCYTKGSVSGNGTTGGLGGSINGGSVSNCYSTASVSGDTYSGGLVGILVGLSSITNSYSTGSVSGSSFSGGLIGTKAATATATNSFWDITTSGQATSELGIGKTTAEMKTESTFTDATWDLVGETTNGTDYLWSIDGSNNNGYPWLTWEGYSPANNTWDGSESTDFMNKDNWSLVFIPNVLNNVIISSGGNQPMLSGNQNVTINDLILNLGADLTIGSSPSDISTLTVIWTTTGD